MHVIMIMYDSLRRDMLPAYAKQCGVELTNFKRLSERCVTFDKSYVCSMPCMPARREIHTGRANFLHRSWGPLEPFDDSMPELLKNNGIHTHLTTDHYHYIQDGGATYCGRYSTWECYRGQESDAWIGDCTQHGEDYPLQVMCNSNTPELLKKMRIKGGWQNLSNRSVREKESDYTQVKTVENGIDFLKRNHQSENWFLQIEMFDPHEPFDSPDCYQKRLFDPDRPGTQDWPAYTKVSEAEDDIENMRKKYLALLKFCDNNLGKILDEMDKLQLWENTLLIVNTDHGFFLGEHQWWGKGMMPDYEELTHTPLFIWDPISKEKGKRSDELVQTIDLAPTILDYFHIPIPKDMQGISILKDLRNGEKLHKYGIFGYHGGAINITDGRYVYMRAVRPQSGQLAEYTLMPTHMNSRFQPKELTNASLEKGFTFTKNCPVLKIQTTSFFQYKLQQDLLFDLDNDPHQQHPINDEIIENRMCLALVEEMKKNEAPEELFAYYGFTFPGNM